jgi:osmotically-inducible protein OsmY
MAHPLAKAVPRVLARGTRVACEGGMKPALTLALSTLMLAVVATACSRDEASGTTSTTSVEIAEPRAIHQGNGKDDVAVVQSIRQRLVADGALSMRAKNAVVIVQEGVVTLRGEVVDRAEHDLVIAKVTSVPRVVRVDDRLQIIKE